MCSNRRKSEMQWSLAILLAAVVVGACAWGEAEPPRPAAQTDDEGEPSFAYLFDCGVRAPEELAAFAMCEKRCHMLRMDQLICTEDCATKNRCFLSSEAKGWLETHEVKRGF